MKKYALITIVALLAAALASQAQTVVKVWPDGAPNSSGLTGPEGMKEGGRVTNVTEAELFVYPAAKDRSTGMAIIACPGGGYVHITMQSEGKDMSDWMNRQGVTFAVLKYRLPNGHIEVPLSDVQQSIRILKEHAAEWNIDPGKIGVMGGSAGGNLACMASTIYTPDVRPAFQVLFYPATKMRGTPAEPKVTADTPPTFIMVSADDPLCLDMSIDYFRELRANKVPATLHIYPEGGHGWGYKESFNYKDMWTMELEKWLREINIKIGK